MQKPTYEELEELVRQLKKAVAERDELEKKYQEEIARWRLLIEQSRDGIVILDQNCKVYEANSKYADMLGYTMEEVRELHVWDWDFIHSKEKLKEMVQTVDHSGDHFQTQHRRKDGTIIDVEISTNGSCYRGQKLVLCVCRDITERKRLERKQKKLIKDLREALEEIRTLRGIFPICSHCKKIRDDTGYWEQIDVYLKEHSDAEFSHGLCPDCFIKIYPGFKDKKKDNDS